MCHWELLPTTVFEALPCSACYDHLLAIHTSSFLSIDAFFQRIPEYFPSINYHLQTDRKEFFHLQEFKNQQVYVSARRYLDFSRSCKELHTPYELQDYPLARRK